MTTPQLERMEIYRQVRVVLVRHMIDIGRLFIQISMSRVVLHGSLCRLPGSSAELTPTIIRTIFSEMGMIRGVRRVQGEFDNWRALDDFGAAWAPIQARKIISTPSLQPGPSNEPIEIDDAPEPSRPPE